MAFSAAFSQTSFSYNISTLSHNSTRRLIPPYQFPYVIRAVKSSEPAEDKKVSETKTQDASSPNSQPATTSPPPPKTKKPVYSSE